MYVCIYVYVCVCVCVCVIYTLCVCVCVCVCVCPKWQVSRGMPLFGAISASPMPALSLFREEEEDTAVDLRNRSSQPGQRHSVARKRAQGRGILDTMLVGVLSLMYEC